MSDPAEASLLISAGERAAAAGDTDTLRHINRELAKMLPERPSLESLGSTVQRDR
jgi:hypothetical protein